MPEGMRRLNMLPPAAARNACRNSRFSGYGLGAGSKNAHNRVLWHRIEPAIGDKPFFYFSETTPLHKALRFFLLQKQSIPFFYKGFLAYIK
jgi:hypothetical protein